MRRLIILAGMAAAMLTTFFTGAHAQPAGLVQVGVLECRGQASIGFIVVGSVANLGCVLRVDGYRRTATSRPFAKESRRRSSASRNPGLAWGVFAPTKYLGPGNLSGNYAGAQGSATIGVGAGGNVLVGGSNNSIALQPLSLQGQVGLSVAAGLESLELRPGR